MNQMTQDETRKRSLLLTIFAALALTIGGALFSVSGTASAQTPEADDDNGLMDDDNGIDDGIDDGVDDDATTPGVDDDATAPGTDDDATTPGADDTEATPPATGTGTPAGQGSNMAVPLIALGVVMMLAAGAGLAAVRRR